MYSLGVILFELFTEITSSSGSRTRMLKDLHRRVLPPAFLVSYPTVAALVMLLLSPNPADRLSADELLNSTLFTQTLSVRGVLSRARSPVPSY